MVNRSPAAIRLLLVVCAMAFAMPGLAQTTEESYTPEPAHVAYVDGNGTVTRDGRAEMATINVPLVSGDQVRTSEGRIEVLFGDGSVLDIDHFTAIDFLSDELVRLTEGRIHLTIGGRDRVAYRVDTPSGAVRIDEPGEYRIALIGASGRRDVELVTVRGYATLTNELGETGVRAGERAFATAAMAPSYSQAYNSAAWDAFDQWTADRRDERTGAVSAQYLPDEVRGYAGDFDRYGAWQYDVSYGHVWYPRVGVGWRPYYYGRWNHYGPWGWTWIAYDRWGWPTHHYGRWGFRSGVWFWIPSRHWGPAWVYWAGASDYVGWCPLGWDNRPIFSLININIGRRYRGYDPYRAWTVMPRHAFRSHVDVRRYAVARSEIDRAVPRWYVSGATAPIRSVAARRDVTPIYSAGRAGSRGAANLAGSRSAPLVSAPQVSGAPSRGLNRAIPRDAPAAREYRSRTPNGNARRATLPPASGALGPARSRTGASTLEGSPAVSLNPSGQWRSRAPGAPETSAPQVPGWRSRAVGRTPDTRAPYRDLGPGGPEPRYQPQGGDRVVPNRPQYRDSPAGQGRVGAPRGVLQGGTYGERGVPRSDSGRVYAPRGVPRSGGAYARPQQGDAPPAYAPSPSYRSRGRVEAPREGAYSPRQSAPTYSRPAPSYNRPAPSNSRPSPSYSRPPSSPAPSRGAPSAGRPSGGGDRGGQRAAPRGGGSGQSSRPSGGHSRERPR